MWVSFVEGVPRKRKLYMPSNAQVYAKPSSTPYIFITAQLKKHRRVLQFGVQDFAETSSAEGVEVGGEDHDCSGVQG